MNSSRSQNRHSNRSSDSCPAIISSAYDLYRHEILTTLADIQYSIRSADSKYLKQKSQFSTMLSSLLCISVTHGKYKQMTASENRN